MRGLEDSNVDCDQIEEAVRSVNWLENTWADDTDRVTKRLLIDDPDSGSAFLQRFGDDYGAVFRQIVDTTDSSKLTRTARTFDELDATTKQRASTLLEETDGDAASLMADLDSDGLGTLLRRSCSGSASLSAAPISGGAGGPVGTQRVFSGVDVSSTASCDLDVEFLRAVDDYNDRIDSFDAQEFARTYGQLDAEYDVRFREFENW